MLKPNTCTPNTTITMAIFFPTGMSDISKTIFSQLNKRPPTMTAFASHQGTEITTNVHQKVICFSDRMPTDLASSRHYLKLSVI